ncbi:hypothetical protein FAM14222_000621, partial [Propionibacterium freudenreichii]|nr:hypothetical protein [Propionibacterium freudenreichii]
MVEAAARSGALNTASWSLRLGRPLMAVPGPINSALSESPIGSSGTTRRHV